MNTVVWIFLGGAVGWLASLLAQTDARQGRVENIIAGVVGAFAGVYLIGPLASVGAVDHTIISVSSLTASLTGAVAVVLAIRLLRHVNSVR